MSSILIWNVCCGVAGSDRSEQQWLGRQRQRRRGARDHATPEAYAQPHRLQRLALHVTGCRYVHRHTIDIIIKDLIAYVDFLNVHFSLNLNINAEDTWTCRRVERKLAAHKSCKIQSIVIERVQYYIQRSCSVTWIWMSMATTLIAAIETTVRLLDWWMIVLSTKFDRFKYEWATSACPLPRSRVKLTSKSNAPLNQLYQYLV